jgi:hypothetical protein
MASNIQKKTAERMLKNIEMRLQALAMEQQSMNGNVGGAKMRKGGKVRQKMAWGDFVIDPTKSNYTIRSKEYGSMPPGGYTESPYNWSLNKAMTGMQGFGMDTYQTDFGMPELPQIAPFQRRDLNNLPTKPIAITDQNLARQSQMKMPSAPTYGSNFFNQFTFGKPSGGQSSSLPFTYGNSGISSTGKVGVPNANGGGTDIGGSKGMNWNTIAGLAPAALNLIAGLTSGKAQKLNPNDYMNPYADQAFANMPDQFRVDDMLGDNRNAYATYLRNVNQTGNSRGERMANYTSGMNRMNEANTRAWAMKNNQENALRTNKWGMRSDQGNVVAGTRLKVRDMNDANRAAAQNQRMSYLGAAASGAQTYGLAQEQMKNQTASQMAYINALKNRQYWNEWLGLDKLSGK